MNNIKWVRNDDRVLMGWVVTNMKGRRINSKFFEENTGTCRTILLASYPNCCLSDCNRNLRLLAILRTFAKATRLLFLLLWNNPYSTCDCCTSSSLRLLLHLSPSKLPWSLCKTAVWIRKISENLTILWLLHILLKV